MAEQWEVIEGAHSGVRGEFSIWPVDAQGDGDKRIACWIRSREVADLLCAAPALLEACEAMLATWGTDDEDAVIRSRRFAKDAIAAAKGQS